MLAADQLVLVAAELINQIAHYGQSDDNKRNHGVQEACVKLFRQVPLQTLEKSIFAAVQSVGALHLPTGKLQRRNARISSTRTAYWINAMHIG